METWFVEESDRLGVEGIMAAAAGPAGHEPKEATDDIGEWFV